MATIYRIKPAAFAAWLRDAGETPSEHIGNWFAAAGVTGVAQVENGSADQWTKERIETRRAELKAKGVSNPTQQIASESGLSEREIRRRAPTKRAVATAWSGLQKKA